MTPAGDGSLDPIELASLAKMLSPEWLIEASEIPCCRHELWRHFAEGRDQEFTAELRAELERHARTEAENEAARSDGDNA